MNRKLLYLHIFRIEIAASAVKFKYYFLSIIRW